MSKHTDPRKVQDTEGQAFRYDGGKGRPELQRVTPKVSMPQPHPKCWSFKPACVDSEVSSNFI